jgi:hypothetical protein
VYTYRLAWSSHPKPLNSEARARRVSRQTFGDKGRK